MNYCELVDWTIIDEEDDDDQSAGPASPGNDTESRAQFKVAMWRLV